MTVEILDDRRRKAFKSTWARKEKLPVLDGNDESADRDF